MLLDFIASIFDVFFVWLHEIIPNLGVNIIILGIVVKLALTPVASRIKKTTGDIKDYKKAIEDTENTTTDEAVRLARKAMLKISLFLLFIAVQIVFLLGVIRLLRTPYEFEFTTVDGFSEYLVPSMEFLNLTVPDPYYVLPILVGTITFVSAIIGDGSNNRFFVYGLPAFLTFISIQLPAGVALYWISKRLFMIVKSFLLRRFDGGRTNET